MSHKPYYLLLIVFLAAFQSAPVPPTPAFSVWLECITRGPYPGMAQARINYAYAGEFAVTPEDSRLLGDTATGETMILNYSIEPGEHLALTLNVGAQKVLLLKIILFGNLYVVTVYDDPTVKDCSWDLPEATPEAISGNL